VTDRGAGSSRGKRRFPRERIALSIAALVVAVPGGAQVHTTLRVFTPWAGSIPAAGVTIDRTLKGRCAHGSEVLTRADAWHCEVGRRAYDPCFSNSRAEVGANVLCMRSPWEDATAIELTARLPLDLGNPAGDPKRFPPWAMVTAAAQECALITGSSLGRIAGMRVNYACAGSGLLLDLPKRGKTWTQAYAPTIGAKKASSIALRSVWW
jgi:hypothetical protein